MASFFVQLRDGRILGVRTSKHGRKSALAGGVQSAYLEASIRDSQSHQSL
jgi:hypothetical protein